MRERVGLKLSNATLLASALNQNCSHTHSMLCVLLLRAASKYSPYTIFKAGAALLAFANEIQN